MLFVLPVIFSLIALEIIVGRIPNSYSYKYNYVKTHGEDIQALAIGHSQLYDGFKPESFHLPAFNLCNSEQSYTDNYFILREILPYMPHLKMVIMPIGYMNVGNEENNGYLTDRCGYYHKYMNINYDGSLPLKYYFEFCVPTRAADKMISYYFKHKDIVGCDSLGRRSTHKLRNRTYNLNRHEWIDRYTRSKHENFCLINEEYLLKSIDLLMEKKIAVVLVSPPYYKECFKRVNGEQVRFIKDYMQKFCAHYPVRYIDLEADTSFVAEDFFNETHLTEYGAEKFTQRLNNELGI